jgi:hypothetical protein
MAIMNVSEGDRGHLLLPGLAAAMTATTVGSLVVAIVLNRGGQDFEYGALPYWLATWGRAAGQSWLAAIAIGAVLALSEQRWTAYRQSGLAGKTWRMLFVAVLIGGLITTGLFLILGPSALALAIFVLAGSVWCGCIVPPVVRFLRRVPDASPIVIALASCFAGIGLGLLVGPSWA